MAHCLCGYELSTDGKLMNLQGSPEQECVSSLFSTYTPSTGPAGRRLEDDAAILLQEAAAGTRTPSPPNNTNLAPFFPETAHPINGGRNAIGIGGR